MTRYRPTTATPLLVREERSPWSSRLSLAEAEARFGDAAVETLRDDLGDGFLLLAPAQRSPETEGLGRFSTISLPAVGQPAGSQAPLLPAVYALAPPGTSLYLLMVSVGRTPRSRIVLADDMISKFHAFLGYDTSRRRFTITDAGSTNGTYVGGVPLEPETPLVLEGGERIAFGRAFAGSFETARTLRALLRARLGRPSLGLVPAPTGR